MLCIASFLPFSSFAQHELAIEIVEVTGEPQENAMKPRLNSQAPLVTPVYDAGALLRAITGMDAARRGGRGFDPIIRGQSQNQINVISDGAYNFGSCPSRMDPPSTYVGFDNFDKVTVIKGNRSVVYGGGGSGGTILFEHQRPDFSEKNVLGEFVAGHISNSQTESASANLALGNERAFVRLFSEYKNAGNYDDAQGNRVSSAFQSQNSGLILGGDLSSHDYLQLSFEQADENDLLYAGNGMDAPYADSTTTRIKWQRDDQFLGLDAVEINLYRSDVNHLMDNYTLRDRNPMPNGMAAPTSSDTWGGRFLGTVFIDSSELKLGLDYLANDRRARLFQDQGKDGDYDLLVSYMWPDVQQRGLGIFTELDYSATKKDNIRVGLRYDDFELLADKTEAPAGMMASATPATLYQQYYGTDNDTINRNSYGMVLGWDRNLSNQLLASVNLSHSVRNPDTNEAFMARSAMGKVWVGNPEIESEKHQQVDISLQSNSGEQRWSTSLFWNFIDDYIEPFQQGNARLYRNISAELRGFEVDYETVLFTHWKARTGLSYTRGKGEFGNLANIAPLTGKINVAYQKPTWSFGSELIMAQRQDEFDPDVDVNEATPGFAVVNLYGHWLPFESFTFEAGVENLFNQQYAYHVNKAAVDPFDPTAVRVYEPGRQYWLRVKYSL